jgi:hypothetical protein
LAIEDHTRNIQFRRAHILNLNNSETLQALLAQAVRSLKTPPQRLEPVDEEGPGRRFINYVASLQGTLCGHVLVYSEGAPQLLLREKAQQQGQNEEAASYPLEALAAQKEADGTKAEFLESILYFCIRGNNVLVLQSRTLRAKGFEQHINWILKKVGLLDDTQMVLLADQPKVTAASAIKRKGVKEVSIGIQMFEAEATMSEAKKAKIKVSGTILSTLKALLGAKANELKLEDALNGNISATISLSWSRQTTPEAQDVLDDIAIAMRNIDPDDVSIKLNGGMRVDGKELKLWIPIIVKVKDGVVQQTSVFKAMRDAMESSIKDKLIPL